MLPGVMLPVAFDIMQCRTGGPDDSAGLLLVALDVSEAGKLLGFYMWRLL